MRPHDLVARADMLGQDKGDRRWLLAVVTLSLECETHRVGMRHVTVERLEDGGVELGGSITFQQPRQRAGDVAEVVAALGGAEQQGLAGRDGLDQPIGRAVMACPALGFDECIEMSLFLDPFAAVVAARVLGEDVLALDDAQPIGVGQHGQDAAHLCMGHRVVVLVEPDIGRLVDADLDPLDDRIRIVGQAQQQRRLFGEDLADAAGGVFGTAAITGRAAAPGVRLGIEIVDAGERAGGEEGVADKAYGAFDATLFVPAGDRDGARFVTIVGGEFEQGRIEADRVAVTFQHGAAQIVIQDDPGHALPRREGGEMAAQEIFRAGIEEEAQEDVARVTQDQYEGHERAARATDRDVPKMRPLCREPDYAEHRGDGRVNWII